MVEYVENRVGFQTFKHVSCPVRQQERGGGGGGGVGGRGEMRREVGRDEVRAGFLQTPLNQLDLEG